MDDFMVKSFDEKYKMFHAIQEYIFELETEVEVLRRQKKTLEKEVSALYDWKRKVIAYEDKL